MQVYLSGNLSRMRYFHDVLCVLAGFRDLKNVVTCEFIAEESHLENYLIHTYLGASLSIF